MHRLPTLIVTLVAALMLATFGPASAGDPPYLALGKALGTPVLGYSYGPADKSQLQLKFVPDGETVKDWKKMTTVSIVKVTDADTDLTTRSVIAKLQAQLKERHATVHTFDQSPLAPVTCYFEFSADGELEKGVVYSPHPGYVTVAQVGSKDGGSISAADVKELKSLIGR
jgi:hypothetical protein